MQSKTARFIDIAATLVVALGLLFGGRALLLRLSHTAVLSAFVLAVACASQLFALRRTLDRSDDAARLVVTRDITAVAALLLALAAVLSPQRWLIGASVASGEFALCLDLLDKFSARRFGGPHQ